MDEHLVVRHGARAATARVVILVSLSAAILAMLYFAKPLRDRYGQLQHDRRLGIRDLVVAAADLRYRAILPRLTGGFAYRPISPVRRGARGDSTGDLPTANLYGSYARLLSATERSPSHGSLHAVGLAGLALGDVNRACGVLEQASKSEGGAGDAELLSDLAAAYYARGVGEDHVELILRAIDVSSRALKLGPALAPAAFNRALAIESIHLPDQAIAAWRESAGMGRGVPHREHGSGERGYAGGRRSCGRPSLLLCG